MYECPLPSQTPLLSRHFQSGSVHAATFEHARGLRRERGQAQRTSRDLAAVLVEEVAAATSGHAGRGVAESGGHSGGLSRSMERTEGTGGPSRVHRGNSQIRGEIGGVLVVALCILKMVAENPCCSGGCGGIGVG